MRRDQLPARHALSLAAGAAAAALALAACEKIDYIPPAPVEPWPTRVLMHRGGGSCSSAYGAPCPDNTLTAVLYGLSRADGAEMDIQLSRDGTLWLGHDNEVLDCGGAAVGCFQDLDDAFIDSIATCGGVEHHVRVDDVLAAVAAGAYPDAVLSLDVKGQYCGTGIRDAARIMADEVDRLVRLHGMDGRVLVESDQPTFLERIVETGAPVSSFVVSLGDVDGPLAESARVGATGISFKYADASEPLTASVVAGIHGVGKRIIVWIVNTPDEIAAVWPTLPDVIETDNPDFFAAVPP